jgi:hypothetical protein
MLQIPWHINFKTKRFCIAFYESSPLQEGGKPGGGGEGVSQKPFVRVG